MLGVLELPQHGSIIYLHKKHRAWSCPPLPVPIPDLFPSIFFFFLLIFFEATSQLCPEFASCFMNLWMQSPAALKVSAAIKEIFQSEDQVLGGIRRGRRFGNPRLHIWENQLSISPAATASPAFRTSLFL